jgi:hypothetical protein
VKVVDTESAFDLSKESSQESEISSAHPYEAGYDFRDKWFIRKRDAGGRPVLLE